MWQYLKIAALERQWLGFKPWMMIREIMALEEYDIPILEVE